MRKPHCLTHTARFSRFSVNQTQAACSSFHQGEIRDTVKVTGSKPCSKQIDPYFRGREKKKPTPKNNPQRNSSTFRSCDCPKVNPLLQPEAPLLAQHFKDARTASFPGLNSEHATSTLLTKEKEVSSRVRDRTGSAIAPRKAGLIPHHTLPAEPCYQLRKWPPVSMFSGHGEKHRTSEELNFPSTGVRC